MKISKQFFGEANSLNKGYSVDKIPQPSLNHQDNYAPSELLPSPALFQMYEEIKPGTIEYLLELAKKEQHHTQQLNILQLKLYHRMRTIGQCFGLAMMLLLCYTGIRVFLNHSWWVNGMFIIWASLMVAIPLLLYSKLKLAHQIFPLNFVNNKS